MLKSIISFCLSRRAIVVFGLLLFAVAGIFAFRALDIEAYPTPSPVVLEISAQSPGLSAREMERYYTIPIENGLYTVPTRAAQPRTRSSTNCAIFSRSARRLLTS